MWTTIAEALGITGDGRSPPTFFEHIAARRALLLLDNLEQLPDAGKVIAELMGVAPHITLLATSRRPLRVPGEHEYPVRPLPVAHPAGAWRRRRTGRSSYSSSTRGWRGRTSGSPQRTPVT